MSISVNITPLQQQALNLARQQGGKISAKDAINMKLGSVTCGLLANKGLLIDLGWDGHTQNYRLPDE